MKPITIVAAVLLLVVSAPAQQSGRSPEAAGPSENPSRQDSLHSEPFSDAVAHRLLSRIRDGFTRRNPKLLLSAFDPLHFPGYGLFSDRMRARLRQNNEFRAYFRIVGVTPQDGRTMVDVELQIEETSSTPGPPPTRNTGQARFTFEPGPAGWRIVDVSPRDLLTGVRGPA